VRLAALEFISAVLVRLVLAAKGMINRVRRPVRSVLALVGWHREVWG
jgi:hypothetical protein